MRVTRVPGVFLRHRDFVEVREGDECHELCDAAVWNPPCVHLSPLHQLRLFAFPAAANGWKSNLHGSSLMTPFTDHQACKHEAAVAAVLPWHSPASFSHSWSRQLCWQQPRASSKGGVVSPPPYSTGKIFHPLSSASKLNPFWLSVLLWTPRQPAEMTVLLTGRLIIFHGG